MKEQLLGAGEPKRRINRLGFILTKGQRQGAPRSSAQSRVR